MVSLGGQAPHVLRAHIGRTCGEPNEIELTAAHGFIYRDLSGTHHRGVALGLAVEVGRRGRQGAPVRPARRDVRARVVNAPLVSVVEG